MVGAQTTLNNQLNAAATTATESATMTATMTMMKTKVTAVAVAGWRQRGIGGGGSAAVAAAAAAQWQRQQQLGEDNGGSLARTMAMMARTTTMTVEKVTSHHLRRHCTATACRQGGDKDTGSNSNGKGTDSTQQSTKYLTCNRCYS